MSTYPSEGGVCGPVLSLISPKCSGSFQSMQQNLGMVLSSNDVPREELEKRKCNFGKRNWAKVKQTNKKQNADF